MPKLISALSGLTTFRSITIIPLILILLIISIPVNGQVPQVSPKVEQVTKEFPPGRGFIPPPVDLSHLDTKTLPSKFSSFDPPTSWDWREQGKVSPVKNQSTCGACYAFASIANIESKLLIDGEGTFDFSENNAKECNYYDRSCSGGNFNDMANFFSKKGTVLESCDPYVAGDVSCNSSCAYSKTLLDWRTISGNDVPSITVLKNYIYTYGPVYTTLYTGDAGDTSWETEFNNYDGSYTLYYTGSYDINHAVMIVGWDDDLTHAGGTGGWIVKNSWGTGWGGTCGYGSEGGYFTIAYGSAKIGSWSSFIYDWQDYDTDGELLYYDEGGWTPVTAPRLPGDWQNLHRLRPSILPGWSSGQTMLPPISIFIFMMTLTAPA